VFFTLLSAKHVASKLETPFKCATPVHLQMLYSSHLVKRSQLESRAVFSKQ